MKKQSPLADFRHPLVQAKALELTAGETDLRKKIEKIFYYVRDDIRFAFPVKADLVKASETIALGYGQCNTKSTLFLALCKALNIPARIHFSLINKEIQRGLFVGLEYRMMPEFLSHSWIEVEVDGKWRRLDSYINDRQFYTAGKKMLKDLNWKTGFSISCSKGESSIDFDLLNERFVQMDAVVEDHGVWSEPAEYFSSNMYKNRPNAFKLLAYRLRIGEVNKRVDSIRRRCVTGLCGSFEPARETNSK